MPFWWTAAVTTRLSPLGADGGGGPCGGGGGGGGGATQMHPYRDFHDRQLDCVVCVRQLAVYLDAEERQESGGLGGGGDDTHLHWYRA